MRRVAIIGPSGAGKSTLAVRLGQALDVPVVHLDALFWQPGWVEPDREIFAARVREATAGEAWVVDGNYISRQKDVLTAADTVVWLDFPRRVCLWRVVRRWLQHRGNTRPDMGPDCPEKIDFEFLHWIWTFPRQYRPMIVENVSALRADQRLIVLRRPGEVERFLREVKACPCSSSRPSSVV
jgi:adenylate kinase family enzyme